MKYLIIDDDDTFSSVLSRVIERQGHHTISASNGSQAMTACENHSDLDRVILDLKLENESGLSILTAIKQTLPQVEILILTGYSSISTAVEAIKLARLIICANRHPPTKLSALLHPANNTNYVSPPAEPTSINRLEWEHIQRVLRITRVIFQQRLEA